jgi:hypothetical protein
LVDSDFVGPVQLLLADDRDHQDSSPYRKAPLKQQIEPPLLGLLRDCQTVFGRGRNERPDVLPYDPAVDVEYGDEVEFVKASEDPVVRDQASALVSAINAPAWTEGERGFGPPAWYFLSAQVTRSERVVFARRLPAGKRLQDNGVIAYLVGGRFTALRDSEAILLDESFDFALYGDILFILRPRVFETYFSYIESLSTHVSGVLDGLSAHFSTADLQVLKDGTLSNWRDLRKLRGEILDLSRLRGADLRRFAGRYRLGLTVTGEGRKFRIGFKADRREVVIRLLTDSYLASELSRSIYVTTSKRKIGA